MPWVPNISASPTANTLPILPFLTLFSLRKNVCCIKVLLGSSIYISEADVKVVIYSSSPETSCFDVRSSIITLGYTGLVGQYLGWSDEVLLYTVTDFVKQDSKEVS